MELVSDRSSLTTRLRRRELDAVFALGEAESDRDDCLLVVREPIYIAVRSEDGLSDAERLGWRQIAEKRFVTSSREPGPEIHDYIVRRVSDLGRQIEVTRFGSVGRAS